MHKFRGGFTIIEALMVVLIACLLISLAVPFYGVLKAKAGLAGCLGNLRILSVALNTYMQDNNMVWPQTPQGGFGDDPDQGAKWWQDTLSPYGMSRPNWACPNDTPTLQAQKNMTPAQGSASSYAVTQFDELPGTAFKWAQPWAKENSGNHGGIRGPNMLMPDGTIVEGISLMSGNKKGK